MLHLVHYGVALMVRASSGGAYWGTGCYVVCVAEGPFGSEVMLVTPAALGLLCTAGDVADVTP